MKTPFLAPVMLASTLFVGSLTAAETFPGLKAVLSELEWKRAGLDRLTPDEIGVIDAALIRQQAGSTARLRTELASAQAAATATEPKQAMPPRFGFPIQDDGDWRSLPPLKAKAVKWESANRFQLDNGQVWEGFDPITYELIGKDVEIQARPHGQFTLIVDGVNTTLRVMRLR